MATAIVEISDDEEDLQFLCQLQAAEAQTLSLSSSSLKRRRINDSQVNSVEEIEEGPYTAALKGSKSLTWKKHQQLQGTTSNGVTKPYDSFTTTTSGGGACFRCGEEGHWARDCAQTTSSGMNLGQAMVASTALDVVEKACPCGLGNCLVLTANTERNRGRKFYRCPLRQENGGCGFFEWCDLSSGNYNSVEGDMAWKNGGQQQFYQRPTNQGSPAFTKSWNDFDKGTGSQNFSYGAVQKFDAAADNKGYGTKTSSSCFKCGKEGHWARDCPTSNFTDDVRDNTSSDAMRGKVSSDACYKCGQSGHWARDCSRAQSTKLRTW